MSAEPVCVTRSTITLRPDQSRVLLRPFSPGDERRTEGIVARILSLTETQVRSLLKGVLADYSVRHNDIGAVLLERFEHVRNLLSLNSELSEPRRLLIGSYFVSEFSLESAALFNPSIVPHPDQ